MNQALLDAAIAFCEDAQVIREPLETFNTIVGVNGYDLPTPSKQQVSRLLSIKVDGRAVNLVPSEVASALLADRVTGRPNYAYTTRTDGEFLINFYPKPDAVYSVDIEAALRPTMAADQLADDLYVQWVDAVVFSAAATLSSIHGQPFSDPTASMNYAARAARERLQGRYEGSKGRVVGQFQVRQRPFA